MKAFFRFLFILLFFCLLLGQFERFALVLPGINLYLHDLLIVFLFLSWFVPGAGIEKVRKSKLLVPIALIIGAMLLSVLLNLLRYQPTQLIVGLGYLFRWMLYTMLYFTTVDLVKEKKVSAVFLLRGLFYLGLGLSLLGIVQYILFPDLRGLVYLGWDPHEYRLFSTLLDPNFMGIIIVLTLLLGFSLWYDDYGKKSVWLASCCLVFLLTALGLTYSRSAFLGFSFSLPFLLWHRHKALGFGVVAVFLLSIFFLPRPSGEGVRLERTSTISARWNNAQEAVSIIKSAPFFGVGFDMYRYARKDLGQSAVKDWESTHYGAGADNSFLFIWATTGIFGLAVFIWLWLQSTRAAGAKKKANGTVMNMLIKSSILAITIHSQFINSFFYPWVLIWFWLILGVIETKDYK